MNPAEFWPNDAFYSQWGGLKSIKGHSISVCFADGLARHSAMDLAHGFDADVFADC